MSLSLLCLHTPWSPSLRWSQPQPPFPLIIKHFPLKGKRREKQLGNGWSLVLYIWLFSITLKQYSRNGRPFPWQSKVLVYQSKLIHAYILFCDAYIELSWDITKSRAAFIRVNTYLLKPFHRFWAFITFIQINWPALFARFLMLLKYLTSILREMVKFECQKVMPLTYPAYQ